ncbi:hypothetical protein EVAR_9245_1 [Eumeta japonica]|uniref:Uncharacterized protein n=1 Tax=Eumeta variegata TaxID=151549 RepID=A0A4C1TNS3_EUMVA|nr:hypothetical protein EVAR_9245_1 [Eumeta japonica]
MMQYIRASIRVDRLGPKSVKNLSTVEFAGIAPEVLKKKGLKLQSHGRRMFLNITWGTASALYTDGKNVTIVLERNVSPKVAGIVRRAPLTRRRRRADKATAKGKWALALKPRELRSADVF